MTDTNETGARPGEAPGTLDWIQIALAHVLLAGGIGWLVLLYQPVSEAARFALLAAGALGSVLVLARALSWPSLGALQKVSALVTLTLAVAFLAIGVAAAG